MTPPRPLCFIFPDRTGLTAENIGEALLNQFGRNRIQNATPILSLIRLKKRVPSSK